MEVYMIEHHPTKLDYMKDIPNELAPCGVFCGACPSFNKTCLGCPSERREQKRKSKWGCRIRRCCYEEKNLKICGDCQQFPCDEVKRKLLNSHPGEMKFKYRHEIPENMKVLRELGLKEYLKYQKQRWSCPFCSGTVRFYEYKCDNCQKTVIV
jgi:hypothetical protein